MSERAAVYARISEDPRQLEAGVTRQREDCEALVKARGWTLAGVFTDNDVSVLSANAERPQYAALLAAIERGEVDRVVAYGLSRLARNRRERADLIELLRRHGVSVTLIKGSDLDMTSAAGRAVAGLMGEFDTMESEIKSERVARAALQRAEQGRASGHVAYGWRRVRLRDANGVVTSWHDVEEPQQADVVRWIVDQLLSERSLKSITADLNRRVELPPRAALRAANGRNETPQTRSGSTWLPSTVRKLAIRPANVGRMVRGGREFGDAAWPAIVDVDKHDRVRALLAAPERRRHGGADGQRAASKPGARKHLLTFGAVGICGGCGAQLRALTRAGHLMYACSGPGGCTGRRMEWVDLAAETAVVRRLREPDAHSLLTRRDDGARIARERAQSLRAKLDNAADAFAEGEITREQMARITARVRPELEQAEREATRAVRGVAPELVARMAGPHAKARWAELTEVSQRRALIEAMGLRVTLLPGLRGGPGFRPESVRVEFVDPAAEQPDAVDRAVGEPA